MKKLFFLLSIAMISFAHCKKDDTTTTPPVVEENTLIGYWHNYDHFDYQSSLDTVFRDTNQFIMMDIDILNDTELTKYYRDGSSPSQHTYTATSNRLEILTGSFLVTYKLERFGDDSMTLSSLPKPAGGIPFPGDDQDIWVFVNR